MFVQQNHVAGQQTQNCGKNTPQTESCDQLTAAKQAEESERSRFDHSNTHFLHRRRYSRPPRTHSLLIGEHAADPDTQTLISSVQLLPCFHGPQGPTGARGLFPPEQLPVTHGVQLSPSGCDDATVLILKPGPKVDN